MEQSKTSLEDTPSPALLSIDLPNVEAINDAKLNEIELFKKYSLSSIDHMSEPMRLTVAQMDAHRIIYPNLLDVATVDSFRDLRTSLLKLFRGDNKITLVCSVKPNGGSSYVASNLAAAFAFDELKTALLIDANIREPRLHEHFYLQPDHGLIDFLRGQVVGIDSIIYATGIPRLRLIPAGEASASAAEYFSSLRMQALLEVLRYRYKDRYLIIDAPAINSCSDTKILASLVDAVLLVVPYGKVTESQLKRAVEAIGEDKLVGVIVNN